MQDRGTGFLRFANLQIRKRPLFLYRKKTLRTSGLTGEKISAAILPCHGTGTGKNPSGKRSRRRGLEQPDAPPPRLLSDSGFSSEDPAGQPPEKTQQGNTLMSWDACPRNPFRRTLPEARPGTIGRTLPKRSFSTQDSGRKIRLASLFFRLSVFQNVADFG